MATQTRLFLGLIRPPKLIGLPIMYAMVWLFGFVLLFLWVQSWPVIIFDRPRIPQRRDILPEASWSGS